MGKHMTPEHKVYAAYNNYQEIVTLRSLKMADVRVIKQKTKQEKKRKKTRHEL